MEKLLLGEIRWNTLPSRNRNLISDFISDFFRPYQLKNHLLCVHSMYESENENYKQKKSNNQSGFADNSMENEGIDQDNVVSSKYPNSIF